jgi:hypothetical protein
MNKPKGSASSSGQHVPSDMQQHAPHLIIDPPHQALPALSGTHHAQLQRHAAQKTHALMANVMAQARGDIGPYLVLQPTVLNSVLIGPTDEEGVGIDVIAGGVTVQIEPWTPMSVGDELDLFWGTYPSTPTVGLKLTTTDQVGKPVSLPVPQSVIVAGWVSIVARVTRNGSGFQDLSPARPLWVKLDPPGDITPPPAENANLAAPILPPDIIANGVDAIASANGVPVSISPYPNMAEGDRIRLNWGGVYIERTVVKANLGLPVTLTVDDATIRSAGDGDALVVRYQVFDVVSNRSGFSPSATVAIDVVAGNLYPPEVPQANNAHVLDLDDLNGDPLDVRVTAFAPDFALGDTITLNWTGHTAGGVTVPYTDTLTVTRTPVQTLDFMVPNAVVAALAQGDAVITYSLPDGRTSQQTTITIIGTAVSLLPPRVDEAPSGILDASLTSATVTVPANPLIQMSGTVGLIWSGTRADGTTLLYQPTPRPVSGGMVGNDIQFSVAASEFASLVGGTLQVSYVVTTPEGSTLPSSPILDLRVVDASGALLTQPRVVEAPDNITLDPDNVTLQATVIVPADPSIQLNDTIHMYWTGSGAGGTTDDWITVTTPLVGREVQFTVDKDPYVTANDGGTVTVSYTVTRGSDTRSSVPLTLQVGAEQQNPYPVIRTDIVVTEADPYTNTLNLVKTVSDVHVVINYDDMEVGDTVIMDWKGAPGSGSSQPAFTVKEVSPVTFTVNNTVIAPNYNSTVTISYIVRRDGVPDKSPSPPYQLTIENLPLSGSCTYKNNSMGTYFLCQTQESITISDDLEVGAVILTSELAWPTDISGLVKAATYKCDTEHSSWLFNNVGSQPASGSILFPTSMQGVGLRFVLNGNYVASGPASIDAGTYTNSGQRGAIEFVKTGPMRPSAMILFQTLAVEGRGKGGVKPNAWVLKNSVSIYVVSRRSIEGKNRISTRTKKT